MKAKTVRKMMEIRNDSLAASYFFSIVSAKEIYPPEMVSGFLKGAFGATAVRKFQLSIKVNEARASLAEMVCSLDPTSINGLHREYGACLRKRLSDTGAYKKNLKTLFPTLTSVERSEVKRRLQLLGVKTKGMKVIGVRVP